ncbi:hypothetical protein KP79_PYT20197 [Mizuhopecten yessoensis]|uniref:Uncharacterized protein n=1 Tax=Mizuhopecten yessoensis TaxID=6573 RepID=A0A210QUE5_MIZYE|nr:hypothetical protein KP79_PYT20197 [Mizuhopecten yessoensis]
MELIPIVRLLFFINSFRWSQCCQGVSMTTSNEDTKWLINAGLSVLLLATIILVFAYFRWKWAKASTQCMSPDYFDRLRFRVATGQDDNGDHLEHCCVDQSERSAIRNRVYCIHGMHTDNLHPIPENSSNDQSDNSDYINVASRRTDQRQVPDHMYLNVMGIQSNQRH